MDNTNPPPDQSGNLNFDKVDDGATGPSKSNCALCHEPLTYQYYEVNQQVICPPCRDKLETQLEQSKGAGRYLKAFLFGLPAGMIGAGLYYAIMALTGYEFGLIAILIGYMVGMAVRYGSNHRGGIGLQLMAAVITYCAICSTYVPYIIQGLEQEWDVAEMALEDGQSDSGDAVAGDGDVGSMSKQEAEELTGGVITDETLKEFDRYSPAGGVTSIEDFEGGEDTAPPGTMPTETAKLKLNEDVTAGQMILGYLVIFVIALVAPWLVGVSNIIGWLIIGFGVYQAWVMNKFVPIEFKGPFDIKRR